MSFNIVFEKQKAVSPELPALMIRIILISKVSRIKASKYDCLKANLIANCLIAKYVSSFKFRLE